LVKWSLILGKRIKTLLLDVIHQQLMMMMMMMMMLNLNVSGIWGGKLPY